MKKYKSYILLLMVFFVACEEELDMGADKNQPLPVVYCLFAQQDSIHQVVLTKTINGNENPQKMAKIFDSLYFKEAEVYFEYEWEEESKRIYLEKKLLYDKEPGFFSNPDHIVFQTAELIPYVRHIGLYVDVPGLPLASSNIVMWKPFWYTLANISNGSQIAISEENSWKIKVEKDYGSVWNGYRAAEIEIDIIEEYNNSDQKVIKICFFKDRIPYTGQPNYIAISWNLLIGETYSSIEKNSNVTYRKFGKIKLKFSGAGPGFTKYITSKKDELDNYYDRIPTYTNITNGIGLFSSWEYIIIDSLQIDYYSRKELVKDPRLQELKFVY
ncbi:hypothetical protein ACFLTI_06010 [Bacteroidota bacterium]